MSNPQDSPKTLEELVDLLRRIYNPGAWTQRQLDAAVQLIQSFIDAQKAGVTVPVLNGTRENLEARDAAFSAWKEFPETAPDWFELVSLIDDWPFIEEEGSVPYPMNDETFLEEDLAAVKAMASGLPYVLCQDFDSLGGDSVEGSLNGLLTQQGYDRINGLRAIVRAAKELAKKRGWL